MNDLSLIIYDRLAKFVKLDVIALAEEGEADKTQLDKRRRSLAGSGSNSSFDPEIEDSSDNLVAAAAAASSGSSGFRPRPEGTYIFSNTYILVYVNIAHKQFFSNDRTGCSNGWWW